MKYPNENEGKPTLVILGAGATRGASFVDDDEDALSPPLDCDFFKQFERAAQVEGSLTHQVARFLPDKMRAADLPWPPKEGMEDYFVRTEFTKALRVDVATKDAEYKKDKRARYSEPVTAYREAIVALIHDTTTTEECTYHAALARCLEVGDVIATFNYDTVMDRALQATRPGLSKVRTDFERSETHTRPDVIRFFDEAEAPEQVHLLHLHGCIDWDVSRWGPDFDYRWVDRVEAMPDRALNSTDLSDRLVVPPLWTKPIAGCPLLEHLWALMRMAMRRCRRLIVIGYSLPTSDKLMQFLFDVDTNLCSSESLDELVVVNPSPWDAAGIISALQRTKKEPKDTTWISTLSDFAEVLD